MEMSTGVDWRSDSRYEEGAWQGLWCRTYVSYPCQGQCP